MQEMMQQFIKDRGEGTKGALLFSSDRIDLALAPGALFEGTFAVFTNGEEGACGYITSTDSRMECLTKEFNGVEETIGYGFHGEYLKDGDVVAGSFRIISNLGEYELPYTVCIQVPAIDAPQKILNVDHFVTLCKDSWEEALRLFYSRDFINLLAGNDRKYTEIYRALSANPGNQHNMDEFLVACGRKAKISYRVKEEELSVANPTEMMELCVTVWKDGWGYTGLKVAAEGDFIYVEKEVITEDDFLGNQCVIPVYIDNGMLHKGRNFGCIRIFSNHCDLKVPVKVMVGSPQAAYQSARILKEQILVDIIDCYQQYRLKKIPSTTWLDTTAGLVERLVAMNDKDVISRLFQAQVLVMQERSHEAGWVLTHVMELMERQKETDPVACAYYLYLTTMVNRDSEYVRRVTQKVEDIQRKNRNLWKVAWFLLYLNPELRRNPTARWAFLEKQFHYGCTSPIWYLEALQTLKGNPELLRKLGEYEVQVLYYGARKGQIGKELKEQFLYLAGRYREFSPLLLRLLIRLFEQEKDDRVLQEICVQLIKGGKTDRESFVWYEQGVEKELRITRLYEYYMMSMDLEKECKISKKALLYFSWQSTMDYEHAAYLYHYLLKNRLDHAELVQQYMERMERFVADQILKEHINKDLAYLYRELLTPAMITGQMAKNLSRLLFVHKVAVSGKALASVVVYRQDLGKVWRYPLWEGCAQIPLYSEKDVILFEDTEGNRYLTGIKWSKEKLIDAAPFLEAISGYISTEKQSDVEFDKYLWDRNKKSNALTEDLAKRGRRLLMATEVSDFVKGRVQMRLLQYYKGLEDPKELDAFLEEVSWDVLDHVSRKEVLSCLVLREQMEKAYEWLSRLGPDGVEWRALLLLCTWFVRQNPTTKDPVILQSAMLLFRQGKCDGEVISYLARCYQGFLEELNGIRKVATPYEADMGCLCERMLEQMMFTGVMPDWRMEVFRSYLKQETKHQVVSAFLSDSATRYLKKGEPKDELIFRQIGQMHRQGEKLGNGEKLAYLKYYSEEGAQRGQEDILRDFMQDLINSGIRLNFFRKIACCEKLCASFADKTIVEYQAPAGSKVTIHYIISQPFEKEEKPRVEEMKAAPGGVYYKEFVLFAGEELGYYFTIEQKRSKEISQSFYACKETQDEGHTGRFYLINEILKKESMDDFEGVDRELEDLYHKDFLSGRLFTVR